MSYVTVDAPKLDSPNVPATLIAATTPLAYVRFHGRNAVTWNARGGAGASGLAALVETHALQSAGDADATATSLLPANYDLAVEALECRRLVKGYSDTHARGLSKFDKVMAAAPLLAARQTDAMEQFDRSG